MKETIDKFKNILVVTFRKLLSMRSSPHQIALGFAIGAFIGIFPTFGLGGFVIIAISALWKFNVPSAIIGTLLGNPLFAPLWITLSCLIIGISPSMVKMPKDPFHEIVKHYSGIFLRYLLGNSIVSLVVSVCSYFIIIWFVKKYQARKRDV